MFEIFHRHKYIDLAMSGHALYTKGVRESVEVHGKWFKCRCGKWFIRPDGMNNYIEIYEGEK